MNQLQGINIYYLRKMGQQNQTIEIERQAVGQKNRNQKIFARKYDVQSKHLPDKCYQPNCKCPSEHIKVQNLKLCQTCDNSSAPSIRKNKKLPYQSAVPLQQSRSKWQYRSAYAYQQSKAVEREEPVYYYNGWGLPTQKCFVDATIRDIPKQAIQPAKKPEESRVQYPYQPYSPPPQRPQMQPVKPAPIKINYENIDINNRMQNLFLFPN